MSFLRRLMENNIKKRERKIATEQSIPSRKKSCWPVLIKATRSALLLTFFPYYTSAERRSATPAPSLSLSFYLSLYMYKLRISGARGEEKCCPSE